jgi:hypothetical protein
MPQGENGSGRPFFGTRAGATLIVFTIAAGFLLLFEHRAHIPGDYYLLGLILAFCIGIHIFMHGGHGGHGGGYGSHDRHSGEPEGLGRGIDGRATNRSSRVTGSRSATDDKEER